MKKPRQAHQLHLVTPEEAVAGPQPLSQREEDAFLVKDIRRYQQLQREFDQELFGKQDKETTSRDPARATAGARAAGRP